MVRPCQEIDIFKGMQRTLLVTQELVDGNELSAVFLDCFKKCQRKRLSILKRFWSILLGNNCLG